MNYPDDLPGEVYENQEQLEEFLQDSENTKLTEKYDTFIKNICQVVTDTVVNVWQV